MSSHEPQVELILEKIREARNFDFRNYKRATLIRRIHRRMIALRVENHEAYLALLEREPHEFDALISSLLIKVTSFFRDPEIWDALAKMLAAILAGKRPQEELRVWCAGCSTGEEVFSVAMLIAEALGPMLSSYEVKVFGTDLDEGAIRVARRGVFSDDKIEGVPKPMIDKYFTRTPDGFMVKQEIRRIVVFGVNNLVSDAPISRLDLLLCRNVFIYLDAGLQKRVLSRFHYSLAPSGFLVLGRAELIPFASKLFEQVDLRLRIYRKERTERFSPSRGLGLSRDTDNPLGLAGGVQEDMDVGNFDRDALEAVSIPVVTTATDGTVTLWNDAAARLWGRPESEVVGRKLVSLALPGLSSDELDEKVAQVASGKREREVTSGTQINKGIVAIDIRPIRAEGRGVTGILFEAHDVTTLRSLEGEMRRVNDELRDSNQNLLGSNEELRASNEELETTNEELQSANEELQTTNEELQSTNEELETTNEELQSANAELDATYRELAHRTDEMHVMALYHRTIIRSLSAAIVVIDPQGKIGSWNLAAERLLGLPEIEAVGQTVWTLRIPAISRAMIQRIRRALGERRALREENVAYELPAGGEGTAIIAAVPLVDGDRNLGAVILFEDVTRTVALAKENAKLVKDRLKPPIAEPTPKVKDGKRPRRRE